MRGFVALAFRSAKRQNYTLRPIRRVHRCGRGRGGGGCGSGGGGGGTASSKTGPAAAAAVDFAWRTRDRHLGSGEDDVTGTGHGCFIHCRLRASHRCGCTCVLRRGIVLENRLNNQVTQS